MESNYCFNQREGALCLTVNLKNYLNFYNLPVSECWLSGVSGVMGFYYSQAPEIADEYIHGRSGDFKSIFCRLQEQLREPVKQVKLNINDGSLIEIEKLLKEHKLLLVWVNNYYLEYSKYYNAWTYWSLVIVLNIERDCITIFDNGIKTIEKGIFQKAINNDDECTILFTSESTLKWDISETQALRMGLNASIGSLSTSSQIKKYGYGLEKMYLFADELEHCIDSSKIDRYYFLLNRPGGLTLTRESMLMLCNELQDKISDITITKCREIYEQLTDCWRKIGCLLFRLSNSMNNDLSNRISGRIYEAVSLEKAGMECIVGLADKLKNK